MSQPLKITIEEWDGDGVIRIPDSALQKLEVDVGGSLYLIAEYVGTSRCLILSKTPRMPDCIDELTEVRGQEPPATGSPGMIWGLKVR